jgi:hypothetical protein
MNLVIILQISFIQCCCHLDCTRITRFRTFNLLFTFVVWFFQCWKFQFCELLCYNSDLVSNFSLDKENGEGAMVSKGLLGRRFIAG